MTKIISDKSTLFASLKKTVSVFIEELDATVYIRKITGADRLAFVGLLESAGKKSENDQSLELAVSLGLSDEQGNRLFGPDELNELSEQMPLEVLKRLAIEILKANSLGEKSQEKSKKNSKKNRN